MSGPDAQADLTTTRRTVLLAGAGSAGIAVLAEVFIDAGFVAREEILEPMSAAEAVAEIAATWRCAASESSSSGLETPISYYVQSETLPRARPGHPRLEAAPILNEQDVDARNKSGHISEGGSQNLSVSAG